MSTTTFPITSRELWSIPTMIIRGGTSKGVYLLESDLPAERELWDSVLIALFGASDARQIDGLGGAMPTTSKCCIVGPSNHPDADVDYTFAQIGIGEDRVYWDFNCGNLTPSVGTYAILKGLVPGTPGTTTVRVYQTNTKMLLRIDVPTAEDGTPLMDGDFEMAGVSRKGPEVLTDFSQAVGASLGGNLFPTGNRIDTISVEGHGDIQCTIVDLANMCVFFRTTDLGMTGFETMSQGPEIAPRYHAVREAAQRLLGVSHEKTTPWPVGITGPGDFVTIGGKNVTAAEYDFTVRFAGIQTMYDTLHEAFPGTASCCTATAAVTPGTIVNEIYAQRDHADDVVDFAHPSGIMRVNAQVHEEDGEPVVDKVTVARTVRPIMSGAAFVRLSDVAALSHRDPEQLAQALDAEDRVGTFAG